MPFFLGFGDYDTLPSRREFGDFLIACYSSLQHQEVALRRGGGNRTTREGTVLPVFGLGCA